MTSDLDQDSGRLQSVDAYRGFVMLAMASGGIATFRGLGGAPETEWELLREVLLQQFDHVQWRGGVFWDLIQPSFMFLVGVAMPFSFRRRRARGDRWISQFGHAVFRSLVLIALAIFLASNGGKHTNFSFVNVLGQIGLGYTFVFLLLGRRPVVQGASAVLILVAYWLFFALHPLPGPDYPLGKYDANEPQIMMGGFFAHWNKNANAAADFDRWFLNLFPRPSNDPYLSNEGGYATLNFVPSMATMIFGVLAGELLLSSMSRARKVIVLLTAGAILWVLGELLDATICPIVKRIWTPSWVIASTAWTCWMLAAFYWVIDACRYQRWSLPLVAVGANSIAIYLMAQLMKPFVAASIRTHAGPHIFDGPYGPLVKGVSILVVFWLICLWLYKRKIFIKI
jgi:predicted acyltransferase